MAETKHIPHAGGDDGNNTVSDKRAREDEEATTGTETEVERHLQKHARTSASEASVTEYDTCAEDIKRASAGKEGAEVHCRRRTIAERRRHSRSASPTATSCDTRQLMKMFQECMKTTLTTVLEGKRVGITTEEETTKTRPQGTALSTERREEVSAAPTKSITPYNPMAFSHPPMAIT